MQWHFPSFSLPPLTFFRVLYGNNLTELPAEAFDGLGSLQLLLLNANQLHCIRRGTFDPLTDLNLLSLYDNRIKSISNETFHRLQKLQTLHLAKNPLICDCNLVSRRFLNIKKGAYIVLWFLYVPSHEFGSVIALCSSKI